ncbi:MAG: DEAD/DEAH box helicase [Salinivirgaceae bacterium]|nr:DEAD/DEAH box helicase [Salinivirgaceae bacterium]
MKFADLHLNPEVFEGIDAMGFDEATPVQEQVIPQALDKRDMIACAQTGTGKTAAYILPLLHHLTTKREQKIKALILAPTRELVMQIDQQFQGFAYFCGVESVGIYGGSDSGVWDQQRSAIESGANVLIASPGRLLSHLNLGYVKLDSLEYLILDEADKMLDMGFVDDIKRIITYLPKQRQTLMFSATMPPKIRQLASAILTNPVEINIAISKPAEGVRQTAYMAYDEQKNKLIATILKSKDLDSVIIFASTKSTVKTLVQDLRRAKIDARAIHSDLEQCDREAVMLDFRNRKFSVLVATDIVSRGIDIDNIGLVMNYDVPRDPEDYVHRVGRTARAKSTGEAITLINPKDVQRFAKIEKLIGYEIEKPALPEGFDAAPEYKPETAVRKQNRHFHRGGHNNRGGRNNNHGNRRRGGKPQGGSSSKLQG